MSVQNPIHLGVRSEPQPDLAILRWRKDCYARALPGPGDVLLAIEVAESSAEADRDVRIPLYAKAGIPEAWLFVLDADEIEAFRDPGPKGYRTRRIVRRGERLSPCALPDLSFAAEDILA